MSVKLDGLVKPRTILSHPRLRLVLITAIGLVVILVTALTAALVPRGKDHDDDAPEPVQTSSAQPALAQITISLSSGRPETVVSLDPALTSFSIEQDGWTAWAGIDAPNTLWSNAMDNLRQLTGVPPWIRIGANTEDRTVFDTSTNFSKAIYPKPSSLQPYPESSSLKVNQDYYNLVSHLLPGTQVIWGTNVAANDTDNAYLIARAIMNAFSTPESKAQNVSLAFLELGNEADLWSTHGLRASSYDGQQWMAQWTALATNLTESLNLAQTNTRFWGPSFAETANSSKSTRNYKQGFSPAKLLSSGWRDGPAGQLLTTISQHHYSGTFCFGGGAVLQDLLLKSHVRGNLTMFKPDIQAAHDVGLDYVGGEMNSFSCHGAPGVSNSAGAAVWHVDYSLFAATLGIKRIFYHEGIGYKYSIVQPVPLPRDIDTGAALPNELPPHVQPQYYGGIIVAQAIGNSGAASVVEIPVDDVSISAFAVYEHGGLVRAVLINSLIWIADDAESSKSRPHTQVGLSGLPEGKMEIRRLNINFADDTSNVTWAGRSFETADARPKGDEVVQTVSITDGVDISATEVVMLSFL